MKKAIEIILVMVLMAGCSTEQTSTESEITIEEKEESKTGGITVENEKADKKEFDKRGTIKETVLYDADGITITATDIEYGSWDAELNLQINNSSDKDWEFYAGTLGYSANAINGFMVSDGYLNAEVPAGKSANDGISFSYEDLEIYGIYSISEIQLGIYKQDSDYNEEILNIPAIRTSLYGSEDTYNLEDGILSDAIIDEYGYEILYSGEDEIKIASNINVVREFVGENEDGLVLFMEIENNTDSSIKVKSSDISANGLTIYDGTWSSHVINAHCRYLEGIVITDMLFGNEAELYGLTEIGKIRLCVTAYDGEDNREIDEGTIFSLVIPGRSTEPDMDANLIYETECLRIYSVGFAEGEYSWDDDVYLKLLFENTGNEDLSIFNCYDSLSVNDYMTDYSFYGVDVAVGTKAIGDLRIDAESLKKNGCESVEDIKKMEFQIKFYGDDGWNTIDEPIVTVEF